MCTRTEDVCPELQVVPVLRHERDIGVHHARAVEQHVQLRFLAVSPSSVQRRTGRGWTHFWKSAAAARIDARSARSTTSGCASRPVSALSSSMAACTFSALRPAMYTFALWARSACAAVSTLASHTSREATHLRGLLADAGISPGDEHDLAALVGHLVDAPRRLRRKHVRAYARHC